MKSTAVKVIACILAFILFFFGGMIEFLANAAPMDLSEELRELQLELGLGGYGGSGQGIVAAAQAEYESNHGILSGEKYWRAYAQYYGREYQYYGAWCVCFVYYCANQTGYLTDGGCFGTTWYTLVSQSWNYFKDQGRVFTSREYVPEPGDLIYFGHDPGPTYQSFTHIGIVEYVEDGHVHTIEGNYSRTVSKRVVSCAVGTPTDGVYIEGYAKPNYPAQEEGPVEQHVFQYLTREMGLPVSSACGILANIERESSFDPNCVGDYGTSYGLCQWHDSRWEALISFCNENGLDWKTVRGQMEYLRYELESGYSSMLSEFKTMENTAQGAYNAAYIWCVRFERPVDKYNEGARRGDKAVGAYWPKYSR